MVKQYNIVFIAKGFLYNMMTDTFQVARSCAATVVGDLHDSGIAEHAALADVAQKVVQSLGTLLRRLLCYLKIIVA